MLDDNNLRMKTLKYWTQEMTDIADELQEIKYNEQ